jgi:hypothetical protein
MCISLRGPSRLDVAFSKETVTSVSLTTKDLGLRGCISNVLDTSSVTELHVESVPVDCPLRPEKTESTSDVRFNCSVDMASRHTCTVRSNTFS